MSWPKLAAIVGSTVSLAAQCSLQWLPHANYPGVDGMVFAVVEWDPDQSGPRLPVLVLGGSFTLAGSTSAANLVTFDPATGIWEPLGTGVDGLVRALAVLPNGDLVAGGGFQVAGGVAAGGVARWNGTAWAPIGGPIAGSSSLGVYALSVLPNGDLVAGGAFSSIGGAAANCVARWNGSVWSPLGGGLTWSSTPNVNALAVLPNGDLLAGGWFTHAGGTQAVGIARWDGTAWSALGSSVNSAVHAILVLPNGDAIVGGQFGSAGGLQSIGIARWSGGTWSTLGNALWGTGLGVVYGLGLAANGDVLATGGFTSIGGVAAAGVARWNGSTWSPLGSGLAGGLGQVVLGRASGPVVVAGAFTTAGGQVAARVAQWDGGVFAPLAAGFDAVVRSCVVRNGNELVAGGTFRSANGVPARSVATFNGVWSPLGSGVAESVYSLAIAANGDVIAAGAFQEAGGGQAMNIARWDGSSWHAMGGGLSGSVNALVVLPNGDLVAGGAFVSAPFGVANRIARWNGTAWSPMGAGFNAPVWALVVLANGDLLAGGTFTLSGGASVPRIARWNGTSWVAFGGGVDGDVHALAQLDTGDVVAAGLFAHAGGVPAPNLARWNGTAWAAMGTGVTGSTGRLDVLLPLPGGRLLLAGLFTGVDGLPADNLARWDGTAWSTPPGTDGWVRTAARLPDGALAVGGAFLRVGGAVSPFLAGQVTPCPALVAVAGAGCSGSGGANVLTAVAPPWLGAVCRTQASGMPGNGLALAVLGFAPLSLPLPAVLPQGGVGCTQWTTLDGLDLLLPNGGSVTVDTAIPNLPTLVGATFYRQVAGLEFDALGSLTAVTTTNALALTIGAL